MSHATPLACLVLFNAESRRTGEIGPPWAVKSPCALRRQRAHWSRFAGFPANCRPVGAESAAQARSSTPLTPIEAIFEEKSSPAE
jgi:hypothetical protein